MDGGRHTLMPPLCGMRSLVYVIKVVFTFITILSQWLRSFQHVFDGDRLQTAHLTKRQ